ncbi:MAG: hypothetical protein QUS14_15655 [Pyrinomonadaceae bacterium]|nr:hypothetical protein [Pyrinomonadaceae bacterium]
MRSSRLGILIFLALAVLFTSNCSYYNRIMSRKNLVDGSEAYKGRKFDEAEAFFRRAAERDPQGASLEGRIAQLFLARTLHSKYIGNRQNRDLAEQAITEYKKTLQVDPNEQSAYKAVAGLLENLGREDEWKTWVTERANNESIKPQHRAEALTSLAAKQNTCANEISDTDKTKKPIKRDGKDVFQYVKPEDPAELERMRACVAQGTELIDRAVGLETEEIKQIKGLDVKSLTDAQVQEKLDLVKAFESARSYKTSLTIQASRLAEMDGREPDAVRLRSEADAARARFTELSDVSKALEDEKEARIAAQQAAANANANANQSK